MPITIASDATSSPANTTTLPTVAVDVCAVNHCCDAVHAKGWCTFHYNSARNNGGDPLAAERRGAQPGKRRPRRAVTATAPTIPVVVAKLKAALAEELATTPPAPVTATAPPADNATRRHPAFAEVFELASACENVMLVGPAGTGKSFLAEQVAQALGRRFGSISCSAGMSESHLIGRMVPYGEQGQFEFLGTEFLDCFENGGVFLLDEMDAADPNVLLVINSALANGRISVPARHGAPVAKRHPEFVLIAACNTFGRGADRQYVGRSQLDESTLDRFRIGTVEVDYDQQLERELFAGIAGESPAALAVLELLWRYRANIFAARLERCVSTRFVIAAARAVARGRRGEYVDDKLFSGWRADETRKAKGGAV